MAGDPLALVEALHGAFAVTGLQLLSDQLVGHRVVVTVDLDVVVDIHPHLFPLGKFVGLSGQGTQRRALELLEQLPTGARQLLEGAGVEPFEKAGDFPVQVRQREEGAVAQHRQDPAFDQEYTGLRLGLVARLAHPCRQDRDAVVACQVLVRRVEIGLVAVCLGHTTA